MSRGLPESRSDSNLKSIPEVKALLAHGENPGPVIRERSQHPISRRNIDPDALKVLYRLHRHGFTAYLVGGSVRDLLLGRQPKDFDVGTDAHPHEIKRLFKNCFLVGRRFRLAHIRFGNKIIETSTFRRAPEAWGIGGVGGRHRDNTFGTPEEDAHRRDFTINGLFYDIATFRVIDYVGGLQDLERRLVRCIGDPELRFVEDPVRMIRAARLGGRLGFDLDEVTREGMKKHASEIAKAAPARLLEEIYRLFESGTGSPAMRVLAETGVVRYLLPEVAPYMEDGSPETERFWVMLEEYDRGTLQAGGVREALLWAAMFGPLFMSRRRRPDHGGPRLSARDVAESVLRPAARRFAMPRRVYHRTVQILAMQPKLDRWHSEGKTRQLVRRDVFDEAVELWDIRRRAERIGAIRRTAWAVGQEPPPARPCDGWEMTKARRATAETCDPKEGQP